ncbi:MAG: M48 family metallopeptidase [Oscillatoria sp. PMC 1051.18]|nr:M48 family metallopeptidase [Oscillatoria sp. PMC 1050.18]MEC5031585.1 M48 family metallopeptidase [Oscillatoria sp. PMC 1051.18]
MDKKLFPGLSSEVYEHPFDSKALVSLQRMPGVSLMFKKINEYGIDRLFRFRCIGNGLKVNDRNFPEMYQAFSEACKVLDISPFPELYLVHGEGYIKTFTIGVNKSIVILNMDGFELLSPEELVYVFGHELGHIKSKHMLYHQTATVLPAFGKVIANSTLGIGGLATNGVELALYQWVMMAKLTCDRAGLLACQNLDVATSALIKLAGLPGEYITDPVVEDFVAQAREFSTYNLDNLDKVTKILSFIENMRPWAVLRASELLKWVDSGEYQSVLMGTYLTENSTDTIDIVDDEYDSEEWDFLASWEPSYKRSN